MVTDGPRGSIHLAIKRLTIEGFVGVGLLIGGAITGSSAVALIGIVGTLSAGVCLVLVAARP